MNGDYFFALAVGIGIVAGLRSLTAPAVVAWARGPLAAVFEGCLDDPRVDLQEADRPRSERMPYCYTASDSELNVKSFTMIVGI